MCGSGIHFMTWTRRKSGLSLTRTGPLVVLHVVRCQGGALFIGAHLIAGWSRLQQRVALSSGEAELYSSIRGLAELVNVIHVHRELYDENWGRPELQTDATVNQAILMRRGAGGVKHVETKHLWCQEVIKKYCVKIHRVAREFMHAHVLASASKAGDLETHLPQLHFYRD